MLHIVMIEDSPEEILKIQDLLTGLTDLQYDLKCFSWLEKGIQYVVDNSASLILLDLAFTAENISSLAYMRQIPSDIPIIVISNLAHYQKRLSLNINVKAFISKKNLKEELLSVIRSIVTPEAAPEPEYITFPAVLSRDLSRKIAVKNIRYIDYSKHGDYLIHLIDGHSLSLRSVSYSELVGRIQAAGIKSLHSVSQNEIINLDYIQSVEKLKNGRIQVTLINLEDHTFIAGKSDKDFFETFL